VELLLEPDFIESPGYVGTAPISLAQDVSSDESDGWGADVGLDGIDDDLYGFADGDDLLDCEAYGGIMATRPVRDAGLAVLLALLHKLYAIVCPTNTEKQAAHQSQYLAGVSDRTKLDVLYAILIIA
jgi:hypothetical protein